VIRSLKRSELNHLAARVGLSVRGKTQGGMTTLTFLAGDTPLVAVIGMHEASVWLHGYVSAVVQIDPNVRRDAPAWLASTPSG
jgi:hypothetical protein